MFTTFFFGTMVASKARKADWYHAFHTNAWVSFDYFWLNMCDFDFQQKKSSIYVCTGWWCIRA